MLTLKNQLQINCPLEKVFGYLSMPENFPKWNYYLRSVKKIAEGHPIIGASYHQVRIKDEQYFTISAYDENNYIEFNSTGGTFLKFKRRFSFSATAGGCIIDDLFEIRTFLPSFINKIIAKKPQAAVKENLLKLKELLETGATILQDGRRVTIE
jgi:uncharacterized membrane protein